MNSKIIVTKTENSIQVLQISHGHAVRYFVSTNNPINVGDICIGRVEATKKDLNACFVCVAPNVKGFLPYENINPQCLLNRPYDGCLKEGDMVCVQVIRDCIKTKPYALTMDITLPGKYVVLTLEKGVIHTSSKLSKNESGALVTSMSEETSDIVGRMGVIFRTESVRNIEKCKAELKEKASLWAHIIDHMSSRTLYSKLYSAEFEYITRIKGINASEIDEIITDDNELFCRLSEAISDISISLYNDSKISLNALYNVERCVHEACDRRINLPSGGYLIIEPTEALTVIDVNSGKCDKSKDREKLIEITNTEAAQEIARQLILRNISGIIITDYINMNSNEMTDKLVSLIKELAKADPGNCKFVDITGLGLVELTRQKTYKMLSF